MKRTKRNHAAYATLIAVAIGAATTLGHAADLDVRHAWATVGSVGIPDESDVDEVRTGDSVVRLRANAILLCYRHFVLRRIRIELACSGGQGSH